MNGQSFLKYRLYFTGAVTIAIWSLLGWNHFHGGVPSHHILAREDLPEFSNWWGGLLLPLLTWLLLYRIQKRVVHDSIGKAPTSKLMEAIIYGFAGALIFGILLSCFFTLGYADIPGYMMIGLFLLALFVPIYRAECLLGFVIGMTYTFGAVLPTLIGSILALIGVVLYLFVRKGILYVASQLAGSSSSKIKSE